MIEGRWSGPANPAGSWTSLVHREYTDRKRFASQCKILGSIGYSDGTRLRLRVHKRERGEGKRPREVDGYSELIRDCIYYEVNSVDDLVKAKEQCQPSAKPA